jgi:uncharacterized protein DUF6484
MKNATAGTSRTAPSVRARLRATKSPKTRRIALPKRQRWEGVVLGKVAAWDDAGRPMVDFPGNPSPHFLLARTAVRLNRAALGREVALSFLDGDPLRPLITGLLDPPPSADGRPVIAELDGERLVFSADKEIVLRCGDSSITLTKSGKVIIRGAYVLSRSSGVNRIKGGSVQIN